MFKIAEIFTSINGEGRKSGQLALFIRFAGCNLNCTYCDTAWANKSNATFKELSIKELVRIVREKKIYNVTITGGEPLLQNEINVLLDRLVDIPNTFIEVESNGSIDIKPWENRKDNLSFCLDYKLPKSGMQDKMILSNYKYLQPQDTVKFVCVNLNDLEYAKRIIDKYKLCDKCAIYLSPAYGQLKALQIVDFMKENTMNRVNLQLQIHKIIWDTNKRGV